MSNWARRLGAAAALLIGLMNVAHAVYVDGNPLSYTDPEGLVKEIRNPRDLVTLEGGAGMGGGGGGGGLGFGGGARASGPSPRAHAAGDSRGLPDSAVACRGGLCTADRFAGGSGVTIDSAGRMCRVSVNSGAGRTVKELSATIPNPKIGATTVGDVRRLGGDIVPKPTPNNPFHCEMCGITPRQAEQLFTPVIQNPNR